MILGKVQNQQNFITLNTMTCSYLPDRFQENRFMTGIRLAVSHIIYLSSCAVVFGFQFMFKFKFKSRFDGTGLELGNRSVTVA